MEINKIICGDALKTLKELPDESIDCIITSPPYWGLRDYGVVGQLGLEKTPEEYVAKMVEVFREVKRVLKKEGVMFLNLGDSYMTQPAGNKIASGFQQKSKAGQTGSLAQFKPVSGQYGELYGNGDKVKQDSSNRDSSFQNKCGGRKDILQNRSLGIFCPVHGLIPESSEKNQPHKQDQNGHSPSEDFSHEANHISLTNQDSLHLQDHADEQVSSSSVSKNHESSRQRQARNRQLDNSFSSPNEANEKTPDENQFFGKKVCICDIVKRLDASDRRKLDIVFSDLAYLHSTTMFLKSKDLVGIPWRVAFALQADGWYLRQDIIWAKPNPMPESVTDRCTKAHEYVFLLAKSPKYYFDNEAIREKSVGTGSDERTLKELQRQKRIRESGKINQLRKDPMGYSVTNSYKPIKEPEEMLSGRNKRSVWTITTKSFKEAHFATFPEDLITPMVLAGCKKDGLVLDPFIGSGTTAVVAKKLGRNYLGIELNPTYIKIAEERLRQEILL